MRKTLFVVAMLFVSVPLAAQSLFDVIPETSSKSHRVQAMSLLLEGFLSEQRVNIHRQAVESNEFDLPIGNTHYIALQDSVEHRFGGDISASFRVEDAPALSSFATYAGYVAATIYLPDGRVFKIDPDKDKGQVLREVDKNYHVTCNALPYSNPETLSTPVPSKHRAVGGGKVFINTVEFVTMEAQALVGGLAPARAKIQLAVDAMNNAMKNSGVSWAFTLRLADVRSFNVPEAQLNTLSDVANNPDVMKARTDLKALGGLWTQSTGTSAFIATGVTFNFSLGIHQVGITNPWYDMYFSHEVGHNFGLQHNAANAEVIPNDPYPWARGWANCDPNDSWITIMSYATACPTGIITGSASKIIPFYSNPNVSVRGVPTGVKDKADNARMLALGGHMVAEVMQAISSN